MATYLPSLFISTNYNFIYASCTDGANYYQFPCNKYLQDRYVVNDGKLIIKPIDKDVDLDKNGVPDYKEKYSDRIFLHDTKNNESKEISIDEAQSLVLSNLLTSPDGITVSSHYDNTNNGIFSIFGGSSSYGFYLTKGNFKSKINLVNNLNSYYYASNFEFLGWIIKNN